MSILAALAVGALFGAIIYLVFSDDFDMFQFVLTIGLFAALFAFIAVMMPMGVQHLETTNPFNRPD